MKLLVLTVAASLALAGAAQAQRETKLSGGQLGNLCVSRDHAKVEECNAYLSGVADSIGFYQKLMPSSGTDKLPHYVCVPAAVTGPQLIEKYVAWLRDHKEAQRQIAIEAAMLAMKDSFPCGAGQRP